MKEETKSVWKTIVIVILGVFLLASLVYNGYCLYFNNKTYNEANKLFVGDWIHEDEDWYAVLSLKEDNTIKVTAYKKAEKQEPSVYESKYYVLLDENAIVTYEGDVYSWFNIADENTLCSASRNCDEDGVYKYVRGTAKDVSEIYPENNKKKENKSISIIDNATRSCFKETIRSEIEYFGDKENFNDSETYNSYQEYVNKMKYADLSNYYESNDKVNIYIFIGKTCWHCLDEISWLSTQVKEYGKYFNVYTYEVWKNENNNKLMTEVAKHLDKSVEGVPFTIIGNKTYSGFSEEEGKKMIDEIISQYKNASRYDVFDDMKNQQ